MRDYVGVTGNYLVTNPRNPLALLGMVFQWHGRDNLDDRPAAAIIAQEADHRRREAEHLAKVLPTPRPYNPAAVALAREQFFAAQAAAKAGR